MAQMTAWAEQEAPALQTIAAQSYPYHNSGGNAIQELAFVLTTGVEYLRAMQERGLDIESVAPRMGFGFAVGTQFFMEIAKLRAARILWAQVVEAFGGSAEAQKMHLHIRTSAWNKTVYDPYVNMLRTTVEAFAGSMGGCNSMHVAPFDEIMRQPDEFSRRIARNTQLILQQECNFNRLIDPAGGSWYVESLTDQLARAAWGLFQEVEKQGGMLKALQAGFPQSQVAEVAKKRADALASRKDVLLGTNMYPNLFEKNLDPRTPDFAALRKERAAQVTHAPAAQEKLSAIGQASGAARMQAAIAAAEAGATLGEITSALRGSGAAAPSIEPLRLHRGGEPFEAMRKAAEAYRDQHGKRPQVFLANMGPLVQHKARADFTTGFLEVGGFEMIRPEGFDTPQAAAQAAIDSGAQIVVICSTDDTYPDLVPPLAQQLKAARSDITVLLAGYPADQVEAHKAAGVDDFIHLRANCYEMNAKLQQKIGVSA
jgi:methylmalonyl-CoA mutase